MPLVLGLILALAAVAGGGWYGYRWWQAKKALQMASAQIPAAGTPSSEPGATPATSAPSNEPSAPVPEAVPAPTPSAAPAPAPKTLVGTPPLSTPASSRPATTPIAAPVKPGPSNAAVIVPTPVPTPTPAATPAVQIPASTPAPQAAPVRAIEPAPAPVQTPSTLTPVTRPEPQRTEILKPERPIAPAAPAAKPAYSGPASGVIIWSGRLDKGQAIAINGGQANNGTLNGGLPGVPVLIEVDPKDVGIAEAPGPSNGWKGFSLRSNKGRHTVVTIRWRTI